MSLHGPTGQSIMLGGFFLLLVTTYSSFSFIITYIFTHEDSDAYSYMGPLLLIVNYAAYLIALTFTPLIVHFKRMLLIAAVCYATNYAVEIPELRGTLGVILSVFGAIIGGIGAAVLWVSQGGFMMSLFRKYGVPVSQQGRYFGIQNAIIYANSLLGALITTFCLGLLGNKVYFSVLTLIALMAFVFAYFLIEPLKLQVSAQSASVLTEDEGHHSLSKLTCARSLRQFPLMRHILVVLFMGGFMLGFLSSYITSLIPQELSTKLMAGIFLSVEGVGAILGGFFSGHLSDRFPFVQVGQSCLIVVCINLCMIYATHLAQVQTIIFPFICAFVWGFADNYLEGWSVIACGKMYEGSLQSYAVTKQMHTVAFIIFQLYMLAFGQAINLLGTLLAIMVMAGVAFYMLHRYRTAGDQIKGDSPED